MWARGGREAVVAEGIVVVVWALGGAVGGWGLSSLLAFSGRGGCRGRLFVAFLLDARRQFLEDGELEERGEVGDTADGYEEALEGVRRFVVLG